MMKKYGKQNYVEVPKIEIYGVGDLNRLVPFEFEGEIGKEIENYGEPLIDIHNLSITLRDQATLFQAYLLSELGELTLPEDVKGVLKYLFEKKGRNVTDDVCIYGEGIKGMKKVKETDMPVLWVPSPYTVRVTGDERKIEIYGEPHRILIPETGYVEHTVDGAYRPDTGTPFSTVPTREEAEESWVKKGFPPEIARKAVSYFWRMEGKVEKGIAFVTRDYYDDEEGPFSITVDYDPWFSSITVGSFFAKRRAEGN